MRKLGRSELTGIVTGLRRQRRSVDFDSELSGGRGKGKTEERLRGVYRNKP
jgi:hypothetical protein